MHSHVVENSNEAIQQKSHPPKEYRLILISIGKGMIFQKPSPSVQFFENARLLVLFRVLMTCNSTIQQNNFLSVVYLSTRIYVFTFQTGVREVFSCYRCNQNTRTKSKVTCQISKKKCMKRMVPRAGKWMRSAVSVRYERFKYCSRLPENVARGIFDPKTTKESIKAQSRDHLFALNRSFYRYGGHIELIGFKQYYRMPRGHEHDPIYWHQYLRALYRPIFLQVFLEKDCNGKNRSLCRVWV